MNVWSTPETRNSLTRIRNLLIDTPSGGQVRARRRGRRAHRADAERRSTARATRARIDVGANVEGRDLGSVVARRRRRARRRSSSRSGTTPRCSASTRSGRPPSSGCCSSAIAAASASSCSCRRRSGAGAWRSLVFLTLPWRSSAACWRRTSRGGVISLGSLVGFFTVLGIAARNGIMLINHYQHLERVRRRAVRPGPRPARRARAALADPDDGAGDRAGARAAGDRRRHPGPRDRAPDGRSSSWAAWSPRRCSTCSSCRRSTCASGDPGWLAIRPAPHPSWLEGRRRHG